MRSLRINLRFYFSYLLVSKKEDNISLDSCERILSFISTK